MSYGLSYQSLFGNFLHKFSEYEVYILISNRIFKAYRYENGHAKLPYGFHNVTAPGDPPESLAIDLLDDVNPLNPGKS